MGDSTPPRAWNGYGARQATKGAGYYVIDGGDGNVASVTVGETAQAVDDSTRLAADWVRESAADLVEGSPEVTAGEVRVRAQR